MSITRSNVHKPLLAISIILLLVGFSGLFGEKTVGLGKGFGAIFFILFFICNLLKNEKTDEERRAESPRPVSAKQGHEAKPVRDFNPVHA